MANHAYDSKMRAVRPDLVDLKGVMSGKIAGICRWL